MYSILNERSLISISGDDRYKFLQGLITNDVYKLEHIPAIYACMLTPQGKYFADMFLNARTDSFLIDVPTPRKDDILKKFNMYKLRSNISISDLPEYKVIAFLNDASAFNDPRNSVMGKRSFIHQDDLTAATINLKQDQNAYDRVRISNFIAEGEKDLVSEKSFLLEYGLEDLNAIDYKKGCYVGQELVARSHYTGVIRKQIVMITGDIIPEAGTEIYAGEHKLGKVCSSIENIGLALIRTEDVMNLDKDQVITANNNKIKIIFKEKTND